MMTLIATQFRQRMILSQSQVENNFGKGAVRATRVHHAVSTSTCMDWCTIGFTTVIVLCVAAAVVWIAGQIDQIEEHTERLAAGIALAGVPTAIVLLVIKVGPFPVKLGFFLLMKM